MLAAERVVRRTRVRHTTISLTSGLLRLESAPACDSLAYSPLFKGDHREPPAGEGVF